MFNNFLIIRLDLCLKFLLFLALFLLGSQANEVLQSFLQSQTTIEKSILQSDKALTDGEKAIAGIYREDSDLRWGRFVAKKPSG